MPYIYKRSKDCVVASRHKFKSQLTHTFGEPKTYVSIMNGDKSRACTSITHVSNTLFAAYWLAKQSPPESKHCFDRNNRIDTLYASHASWQSIIIVTTVLMRRCCFEARAAVGVDTSFRYVDTLSTVECQSSVI